MVIVVMGPMGCGKSTIGKILSRELGWQFYDGDDFHPETNKKKMASGVPLDDNDRLPWLQILHRLIEDHVAENKGMILACSALKVKYRDLLGIDQEKVVSVFLKGSFELLAQRLAARSHEFMDDNLLQSQLDTLEEPESGITVDITGTLEQVSCDIMEQLKGLQ